MAGTGSDVERSCADGEAGFTLVEIVVVVAIVVTTVLAGVAISLGLRSFAVATAASEFDHLLDSARTIARETRGATLLFAPDVFGDGTEVRVYVPGPNGTLSPTMLPPLHTRATIEESESLGKPPFAFIVHATGSLGGRPGYRTGTSTTIPEIGCPSRGEFHFLIHTAGATAERTLPCRISLATTGPFTLAPWPPTSPAPLPTACTTAPCIPAALPTPPSSSPTCPPNFAEIPTGCTPATPSNAAPHYHVTATLASPTMMVGGTDSVTAQATLTNSSDVPPGTPSSIGVVSKIATENTCIIAPAILQAAGYLFTISALTSGDCIALLSADISTMSNATSDTATITAAITSAQPPSNAQCDLNANNRCYYRIVSETAEAFTKTVYPDTTCTINAEISSCSYVDAIAKIELAPAFGIRPPVDPIDAAHELLIRVLRLTSATYACQPYAFFEDIPAPNPIQWAGDTIGTPTDAPIGVGDPGRFNTINHVSAGFVDGGVWDESQTGWSSNTTLLDVYQAVATQSVGSPFTFTYSSPDPIGSNLVLWNPDFPGCDSSGSNAQPLPRYGLSGLTLVFEVYQARP